mgnify:FL=1|jgi:DNA repair protein RecO (recombination protein O)|tara:strand:+ start:21294 stop:22001 length:708 start_codon:yes stop_codon:yes gene_type:complete
MIEKTQGIALHYSKYSESSVIAKIFTKDFGLKSCIINGVRKKKSKSKLGLLRPLTLLDIEIYENSKQGLKRVHEISLARVLEKITFDIKRTLIAVFISEVLLKTLVEDEKAEDLFFYAEDLIDSLENLERIPNTFPLQFMINLSSFLGFYPSKENHNMKYFDLENGYFSNKIETNSQFIYGENLENFKSILFGEKKNLPKKVRKKLLLILLDYYKLHYYELKNLKSHNVIEELNE